MKAVHVKSAGGVLSCQSKDKQVQQVRAADQPMDTNTYFQAQETYFKMLLGR